MSFTIFNRVNGLPLTVFTLLTLFFVCLGWYFDQQEQQRMQSKARAITQQVASSIEVFAADRRRALEDLMITWPDHHPNPVDWFQAHAKTLQYVLPGFQDIMWADSDGHIIWSIDTAERDARRNTPLTDFGLSLNGQQQTEFSTSLRRHNDDFYVYLARPITPYDLSYGYIAASFDIRSTLFVMVGELVGEDFSFTMLDKEQALLTNGAFDHDKAIITQPLSFAGRDWQMRMQANRGLVGSGFIITILGILMSLVMAIFVRRQLVAAFRLNMSQERYRAASESALDAILVFSADALQQDFVLVEANNVAQQLFNTDAYDFRQHTLAEQCHQMQLTSLLESALHVWNSGQAFEHTVAVQHELIRADWIKIQIVKSGEGIAVTVRDISEEYKNQQALRASEAKFRRLVENLNGHFIYSYGISGQMNFVSNSVLDILGYEPDWFAEHHEECVKAQPDNIKMVRGKLLMGVRPEPYIVAYYGRDDAVHHIEYRDTPVFDGKNQLVAIEGIGRDVTEDIALQRKVHYQANHDQLTGLYNRYAFDAQLKQQIARRANNTRPATLCYVDMDKFKLVNDTCGHQAGDDLLRQVAGLLQSDLRSGDTIARVGGDEFCLIFPDMSVADCECRLQRLLNLIREFRFRWHEQVFHIGASIGVVEITSERQSASDLIKAADHACYQAKNSGRNRYCIFDRNDQKLDHKENELYWVNAIQDALQEDRFELFFQPIEPLNQPVRGSHYEILVRMLDDDGGYVNPGVFIPLAEQHDLMTTIDEWVFEHTLQALEQHPRHLDRLDKCAINLSGKTLGSDLFLDKIIHRLRNSVVPAEKLCFEITETAAVTNLSVARTFIDSLRELGCRFALDDFGAGMSSFTYLKNMAVDYVKIDGSFVRNLAHDKSNFVTVKAIHEIASSMDKLTVAEFVSDEDTRALLVDMGIGYGQGFALGKPSPLLPMLAQDNEERPTLRVVPSVAQ